MSKTKKVALNLRKDIYEKLRAYTVDPIRGRAAFGAVSKVINTALERYFEELTEEIERKKQRIMRSEKKASGSGRKRYWNTLGQIEEAAQFMEKAITGIDANSPDLDMLSYVASYLEAIARDITYDVKEELEKQEKEKQEKDAQEGN